MSTFPQDTARMRADRLVAILLLMQARCRVRVAAPTR
jgi:hypothetical protein